MQSTSIAITRPISKMLAMSAAALAFAVLIACGALVRIPVPGTPVPLTLQTFALFLGAGMLRRGFALQMVAWYIVLGLIGTPFFAFGGGVTYAFGATGGYLWGFILAAALLGYGTRAVSGPAGRIGIYLAAAGLIYVPGVVQLKLATGVSWQAALGMGIAPFILFDMIKALAAYGTVGILKKRFQS